MKGSSFWIGLLLAFCVSATALAEKNVTELVEQLRNNQTEAIAADSILGQITPLFSGYASLNQKVCLAYTFLHTHQVSRRVSPELGSRAHANLHAM